MLINKKIEIKITKKTIEHFINLEKDVKLKDEIEIDVSELNKGSCILVDVVCDICGNKKTIMYKKYYKNINNGGFYACSSKCAQEKVKKTSLKKFGKEYYTKTNEYKNQIKKTNLNKYGTDHHLKSEIVKNKIEKTNLNKYGVKNVFQSEKIKEKIKETNLEKYGSENPFGSDQIKEKIKETNLEKYGVEYPQQSTLIRETLKENNYSKYGVFYISQINEIKEKVKNTNIKKYGVKSPFQLKDSIKKSIESKRKKWYGNIMEYDFNIIDVNFDKKIFKIKCQKNHIYEIGFHLFYLRNRVNTAVCTKCNPINSSKSGYEVQLHDFIKENYNDMIRNNRKLLDNKYELDIYIPDLKLAFEFNGVYWHNELNKPNDYHLNKTELCEKKRTQLIHIYEDDWIYKNDIVKSMILNKLGKTPEKIYGRKCEIKEITDNKLVREFLNKNHIQGFIGSSIKLGLFHNEELVSLMIFGKRRIGKKTSDEYELLRFCSKLNTNVIESEDNLFKYFVENYKPSKITTYADRSWSTGDLYKKLGFEYKGKTQLNYYYVIDGIRHHRFNYRKDKLIKEGFDKNKTEHEIMIDRGIYRIYDSGNLKFEY